jgi:hypothetical protein
VNEKDEAVLMVDACQLSRFGLASSDYADNAAMAVYVTASTRSSNINTYSRGKRTWNRAFP